MVTRKRILLLNGESAICTQVIAGLAVGNYDLYVGGNSIISRCFLSKHTRKHLYYGPVGRERKALSAILDFVKRERIDLVFPLFTDTYLLTVKYKNLIEKYTKLITCPNYTLLRTLNDKQSFLELASQHGFRIPDTTPLHDATRLREVLTSKLTFPLILKPRISAGGYGITVVNNKTQLVKAYQKLVKRNQSSVFDPGSPLLQEYVPGGQIAIHFIMRNGVCYAAASGVPVREFTSCGVAIEIRSVPVKLYQQAFELSLQFWRKLKFDGITSITFRVDKHNELYVIESNPRHWSDIGCYIKSGVNFPLILCNLSLAANLRPVIGSVEAVYRIPVPTFLYSIRRGNIAMGLHNMIHDLARDGDFYPHLAHLITLPWYCLKSNPYWFL